MKKVIEAVVLTLMLTGILAATNTPLTTKLQGDLPLPAPVCMPDDTNCKQPGFPFPGPAGPGPSVR